MEVTLQARSQKDLINWAEPGFVNWLLSTARSAVVKQLGSGGAVSPPGGVRGGSPEKFFEFCVILKLSVAILETLETMKL